MGYNEFKFGILSRPLYETWAETSNKQFEKDLFSKKQMPDNKVEGNESAGSPAGSLRTQSKADIQHSEEESVGLTPIERHASQFLPRDLRRRKNSLFTAPQSMRKNSLFATPQGMRKKSPFASPQPMYADNNQPHIPAGTAAVLRSIEQDDDNDLPVALKRVASRRISVTSQSRK